MSRPKASGSPDSPKKIRDPRSVVTADTQGASGDAQGTRPQSRPSFVVQLIKYVVIILLFIVEPAIAIGVLSYADTYLHQAFAERIKSAPKQKLGNLEFSLRDVYPEVQSLDLFCSEFASLEAINQGSNEETICDNYSDIKKAQLGALFGVLLSPVVPLLMTFAAAKTALNRRRIRELRSGLAAWILLKLLNKIIGLETAPFTLAVGFGCAVLGLGGLLSLLVGLAFAATFALMKGQVVESYTDGILTVELEPEMPEPRHSAAQSY
jgi:hypothetical protein